MPIRPSCAPTCSLNLSLSDPVEHTLTPFEPLPLLIDTAHFRYPSPFLFTMEAYDTSLLRSMRQAALVSGALAVTLLKRWDDQLIPISLHKPQQPWVSYGAMKLRESVMLFAGVSYGATCSLFHLWARF